MITVLQAPRARLQHLQMTCAIHYPPCSHKDSRLLAAQSIGFEGAWPILPCRLNELAHYPFFACQSKANMTLSLSAGDIKEHPLVRCTWPARGFWC